MDCPTYIEGHTTETVNVDQALVYIVFYNGVTFKSIPCWPPSAGNFPRSLTLPLDQTAMDQACSRGRAATGAPSAAPTFAGPTPPTSPPTVSPSSSPKASQSRGNRGESSSPVIYLIAALGAVVVIAAAGFAVWWFRFRKEVEIEPSFDFAAAGYHTAPLVENENAAPYHEFSEEEADL